jgi:hypothetical protein
MCVALLVILSLQISLTRRRGADTAHTHNHTNGTAYVRGAYSYWRRCESYLPRLSCSLMTPVQLCPVRLAKGK